MTEDTDHTDDRGTSRNRYEYQILMFTRGLTIEDMNRQGEDGWELISSEILERGYRALGGRHDARPDPGYDIRTVWKRAKP